MDVRVIVSPIAGVFAPLADLPDVVTVGSPLGFVNDVPVVSPFDGVLAGMDALAGERLEPYQRVAWLHAA
jgi:predicted deacylase